MSTERIPWYGIASSISTHKWVINIMLYKDKEEAERHAQNLRENDFAPKYVEVVEVFLPVGDIDER